MVWGALHGAYLIAGLVSAGARGRVRAALGLERHLVVVHVQGAAPLSPRARIAVARTPVRWAAYACTVLTIMTSGVFQSARFIHFQV